MRTATQPPYEGSSSTPLEYSLGTGGGSLTADLLAKGIAIQRQTPRGAIRPFGEDTGTADESAAVGEATLRPQGTSAESL